MSGKKQGAGDFFFLLLIVGLIAYFYSQAGK
jgi:hypothetical protein